MFYKRIVENLFDPEDERPLWQQVAVYPEVYEGVPVERFITVPEFCPRLHEAGVHDLSDLLSKTYEEIVDSFDMMWANGMLMDISDYLEDPTIPNCLKVKKTPSRKRKKEKKSTIPQAVTDHVEEIAHGDFHFLEGSTFTRKDLISLKSYREAYNTIGPEFAQLCFSEPENVRRVQRSLKGMDYFLDTWSRRRTNLRMLANDLSEERLNCKAEPFIHFFAGYRREAMNKYAGDPLVTIGELVPKIDVSDPEDFLTASKFFNWCNFDSRGLGNFVLNSVWEIRGARKLIRQNAQKGVIRQIPDDFDHVRGREKQLEFRAAETFCDALYVSEFFWKVFAEQGKYRPLTVSLLEKYFGEDTKEAVYLLRICEGRKHYKYDKSKDAFLFPKEYSTWNGF